jgi:hypothetical protein
VTAGDDEGPPPSGAMIRPFLDRAAPTAGWGGPNGSSPGEPARGERAPEERAPGGRLPGEHPAPGIPAGGTSIRPFLVTAGRTTGATDIAVEAQVMITARGQTSVDTLSFEYRDIVCLCEEPLAVAEIAARLSLHLGVIRVLVGDLKHQGMVTTFEPEVDPTEDVDTILRVINGLRQRT